MGTTLAARDSEHRKHGNRDQLKATKPPLKCAAFTTPAGARSEAAKLEICNSKGYDHKLQLRPAAVTVADLTILQVQAFKLA